MNRVGSVVGVIVLLFLGGCATVEREEGKHKEVPAEAAVEEVRTRAERVLPEYYEPGKTVTVTLKVSPAPDTSGVIVEETLPEGWEMQKSSPDWMQRQKGNVYKWLVWGSKVEPFEIVYEVMATSIGKEKQEFRGTVKTHREKSAEIKGHRVIIPAK